MVDRIGRHAKGRTALVDGFTDRSLSFDEMRNNVLRVAGNLSARGVKRGDVVAIFSPNVVDYHTAFVAVTLLGGVVTTVNPTYEQKEIEFQLNDSKATLVFTVPPLMDKLQAAMRNAPLIRDIVTFGGPAVGATPFSDLVDHVPPRPVEPPRADAVRDVVALPYSSGTTGLPKGVCLTHSNLTTNLLQLLEIEADVRDDDVYIAVLPFFHIYGLMMTNKALVRGIKTVVFPRFDLEKFLEAIQKHRVTYLHIAPPIAVALAKHPLVGKYDLSSVRMVFSGAAPLGVEVSSAVADRLKCKVKQAYGMTELSPASHVTPTALIKPGAVGVLVPNSEARVVCTESGKLLGQDEVGEIHVRGPMVMKGYLNRDDATKATILDDGFLRTGDIGFIDKDGYLHIQDRVKELIKYKGFQVPPAELEALLLGHPSIADCAVIGRPCPEAGELPLAFVVTKPNISDVAESEIQSWVAERVAPHKKLRGGVRFVPQVPKSASGKILRRLLKDQILAEMKK
eukprot:Opistho-2@22770